MKNRVLVSLNGKCSMGCRFCFADELVCKEENDTGSIVDSIADKAFDIIYVSHFKENFLGANEGIDLCQKLWDRYHKDLFIISRRILDSDDGNKIIDLADVMREEGNRLYWAESVVCTKSYSLLENEQMTPSPEERINYLGGLSKRGIYTFLCIRPVFPKEIVPIEEIYELVDMAKNSVYAIITGPLIVSEQIIKRIGMVGYEFRFTENATDYLRGLETKSFKYVDVEDEIDCIKKYCKSQDIKAFNHTLQAVDYIEKNK